MAILTDKAKQASGAPIIHELQDEDWSQRRFVIRDPSSVTIDVVQLIEPKVGYYDQCNNRKILIGRERAKHETKEDTKRRTGTSLD